MSHVTRIAPELLASTFAARRKAALMPSVNHPRQQLGARASPFYGDSTGTRLRALQQMQYAAAVAATTANGNNHFHARRRSQEGYPFQQSQQRQPMHQPQQSAGAQYPTVSQQLQQQQQQQQLQLRLQQQQQTRRWNQMNISALVYLQQMQATYSQAQQLQLNRSMNPFSDPHYTDSIALAAAQQNPANRLVQASANSIYMPSHQQRLYMPPTTGVTGARGTSRFERFNNVDPRILARNIAMRPLQPKKKFVQRLSIEFQVQGGEAMADKCIQGGRQPDMALTIKSNFEWHQATLQLMTLEENKQVPFKVELKYGDKEWSKPCLKSKVERWTNKPHTKIRVQFCEGYFGIKLHFNVRIPELAVQAETSKKIVVRGQKQRGSRVRKTRKAAANTSSRSKKGSCKGAKAKSQKQARQLSKVKSQTSASKSKTKSSARQKPKYKRKRTSAQAKPKIQFSAPKMRTKYAPLLHSVSTSQAKKILPSTSIVLENDTAPSKKIMRTIQATDSQNQKLQDAKEIPPKGEGLDLSTKKPSVNSTKSESWKLGAMVPTAASAMLGASRPSLSSCTSHVNAEEVELDRKNATTLNLVK